MQQAHFCQAPGNIRHILTGEERAPQCVFFHGFSPHWKSLRKHSRYLGMILLPLSMFKQISLQIPQSNKHGSMNLKGFCCHLGSLEVSKPCETIRNLISSHISCSWGAKSQTFPTDSSATASIISGQSMPAVAYPELLCSWRIFSALERRYQDSSGIAVTDIQVVARWHHTDFLSPIIPPFWWVKSQLSSYVSWSFLWPISPLSQSELQFPPVSSRFFAGPKIPQMMVERSCGIKSGINCMMLSIKVFSIETPGIQTGPYYHIYEFPLSPPWNLMIHQDARMQGVPW